MANPRDETRPFMHRMAQRKQNAPCIQDMLYLNKAVADLQSSTSEKFHMPKLDLELPWRLAIYHDAGWGNAFTEDEAQRRIAKGEPAGS
eukprot:28867-Pyramimonas_sp.AAC.1